jgi:pimeloyl-ACP methyl ester carboxylesterase
VADRQIVYLHGFPGGPEELQAFGPFTNPIFAPDRRNDAPHLDFTGYVDHLTRTVCAKYPLGAITLIGFSAGARLTLELSAKLESRTEAIILISAAAPIQLGDFLENMAGRLVFTAAKRAPFLFGVLTLAQAQLALWAPNRLFRAIFADAQGSDHPLKADWQFKQIIQSVIVKSLQSGSVGYRREVLAYVAPWGSIFSQVTAPVTLWHGTSDNWTPIGMADTFEAALPNVVAVHRLSNFSHYSTLRAFLESMQGNSFNPADRTTRP